MTSPIASTTNEEQLGYTCFRNDEWCPITWPSKVCVPEISGCFYLMYAPDNARIFIRADTSFGSWEFDVAAAGGCQSVWDFGIGNIEICIKDVIFSGNKLSSVTIELKACLPYGIGCAIIYSHKFTISYIVNKSNRTSIDNLLDAKAIENMNTFEAFVFSETLVHPPHH
jgi:hypothetical protein